MQASERGLVDEVLYTGGVKVCDGLARGQFLVLEEHGKRVCGGSAGDGTGGAFDVALGGASGDGWEVRGRW